MSGRRLPWLKWFSSDWLLDAALRDCSPAARGVWIDMLCVMDGSQDRGYLVDRGQPMTTVHIAKLIMTDRRTFERCLAELERKGVFSRDSRGAIFSRRMVRDQTRHNKAVADGKQGGNPLLSKNKGLTQSEVKGGVGSAEPSENKPILADSGLFGCGADTARIPPGNRCASNSQQNSTSLPSSNNGLADFEVKPPVKLDKDKDKEEESKKERTTLRVVLPKRKLQSETVLMEAVAMWNAMATRSGVPKVQRLTDKRRRDLSDRLREHDGIEAWHTAMDAVEASPFLTGKTSRDGWTATIDFVIRADQFTRLLEGSYAQGRAKARTTPGGRLDWLAADLGLHVRTEPEDIEGTATWTAN